MNCTACAFGSHRGEFCHRSSRGVLPTALLEAEGKLCESFSPGQKLDVALCSQRLGTLDEIVLEILNNTAPKPSEPKASEVSGTPWPEARVL